MEVKEKKLLLVQYLYNLFTDIREDWSDPRSSCRDGWEVTTELRRLVQHGEGQKDAQWYSFIQADVKLAMDEVNDRMQEAEEFAK